VSVATTLHINAAIITALVEKILICLPSIKLVVPFQRFQLVGEKLFQFVRVELMKCSAERVTLPSNDCDICKLRANSKYRLAGAIKASKVH
jgi:hypothetical protein